MKRIVLVILLFSLISTANSQSLLLRSVDVHGNRSISTGEILSWMDLQPQTPFTLEQLQRDLKTITSRYYRVGHYFAVVQPSFQYAPDSSSVSLTLNLTEGPRVTIGTLTLSGNGLIPTEKILERFETRVGEVLDERLLEQDFEQLLTLYEVRGYPFAKVRVGNITLAEDGQSLDIAIDIDEGPIVRISEVRVEGNSTTKESVVIRETRIKLGEAYDHEKISAVRPLLMRLNVFSSVSDPELYVRGEKARLLIKVREGNTNTFDGILGYVPPTEVGGGDQKGFLTGLVTVSMRNLFGTARRLHVRWQREDRSTQELGIRYLEPWVFGIPVNVGLGVRQRQQDSSYVKRQLEFKASMLVAGNLSVGATFNRASVIPSSDRETPSPVLKSRTTLVGVDLEYDTRDNTISPRGGLYYRTDYQIGTKKITKPVNSVAQVDDQVTVQSLGVDVQYYVATFFRQVLALSLHGREVRGSPIDESDLFRLGGTNSLRGYRENQFLGSRLVWSNVEYRFLIDPRSFFYVFFDGGYYFRPGVDQAISGNTGLQSPESAQDFKYGFGVGLRVETRLGLIGVSFALGEGDTISTGKIHVGLINEF
ncbi:MAG: POTRA domain-containing protein [Bacteroidota bacterium]